MGFDQKKALLISILPVSVTEYIIKNPAMTSDDEGSYDALEAGLMEYLGLLEAQGKMPIGKVNAANDEPPPLSTECEYSEPWYDEYHGKWVCSMSEINAAAKRRRDEDDEEDSETKEPEEKYPKGKGKGKR